MTYSAPRTHVRAARNLVLATSPAPELKDDVHCLAAWPQDIDFRNEYDTLEAW
jgi:hypothetical protein